MSQTDVAIGEAVEHIECASDGFAASGNIVSATASPTPFLSLTPARRLTRI
jgi:hypothetical protein